MPRLISANLWRKSSSSGCRRLRWKHAGGNQTISIRTQKRLLANGISIMTRQKQGDNRFVTRRSSEVALAKEAPTSANDNDWIGSPQLPLMTDQESFRPQSAEGTHPRPSWKGTFFRLLYVIAVSVSMLGWLYVIWLAVVSGLEGLMG